jgi:hypothetical protein
MPADQNTNALPPAASLLVGTPAYGGMAHVDYVHSLLGLARAGVNFSLLTIGNESLITRARNSIISKFHELKAFTHLLFLDGDVHVDGRDIVRLLAHDRDAVGAPVPLKGRGPDGRQLYNTGQALRQDGELVVTDYIGTAVLLLSRRAVDALVADAERDGRVYAPNPHARGSAEGARQFDVFRVGVVDGVYLSEDYWACRRLRELGFELFADPQVKVQHQGMAPFGG